MGVCAASPSSEPRSPVPVMAMDIDTTPSDSTGDISRISAHIPVYKPDVYRMREILADGTAPGLAFFTPLGLKTRWFILPRLAFHANGVSLRNAIKNVLSGDSVDDGKEAAQIGHSRAGSEATNGRKEMDGKTLHPESESGDDGGVSLGKALHATEGSAPSAPPPNPLEHDCGPGLKFTQIAADAIYDVWVGADKDLRLALHGADPTGSLENAFARTAFKDLPNVKSSVDRRWIRMHFRGVLLDRILFTNERLHCSPSVADSRRHEEFYPVTTNVPTYSVLYPYEQLQVDGLLPTLHGRTVNWVETGIDALSSAIVTYGFDTTTLLSNPRFPRLSESSGIMHRLLCGYSLALASSDLIDTTANILKAAIGVLALTMVSSKLFMNYTAV